jgi:hypothetical protein
VLPQTGSVVAENLDVNFVTKQWQNISRLASRSGIRKRAGAAIGGVQLGESPVASSLTTSTV